MSCFTTTIRQNSVPYNVTISVEDAIPPQECHAVNASSDIDYFGEKVFFDYVVYDMDNKLVDNVEFSDRVLLREFELYAEQNDLTFKRGY